MVGCRRPLPQPCQLPHAECAFFADPHHHLREDLELAVLGHTADLHALSAGVCQGFFQPKVASPAVQGPFGVPTKNTAPAGSLLRISASKPASGRHGLDPITQTRFGLAVCCSILEKEHTGSVSAVGAVLRQHPRSKPASRGL